MDTKRKQHAPGKPFVPGDPRINRKGRPPLSESQRAFRQQLHDLELPVLAAVKVLIAKRDATVINKLIEKLAGAEPEDLTISFASLSDDERKQRVTELLGAARARRDGQAADNKPSRPK